MFVKKGEASFRCVQNIENHELMNAGVTNTLQRVRFVVRFWLPSTRQGSYRPLWRSWAAKPFSSHSTIFPTRSR